MIAFNHDQIWGMDSPILATGVHLALFPHLLREALRGRVGKQCSADSVSICCDSVGLSQHSPSKFQNFSTR